MNSLIIILTTFIGGILGAMGGAEHSSKMFRRLLLPGIITGVVCWYAQSLLTLSIMLMGVIFGMGYGIPCPDDPKPSIIGKFFYALCHQNEFWANIFTRGSLGAMICLMLISIPVTKHNWNVYILSCALILFAYTCLSWRPLGVYQFFKWQLLWSETILYAIITLASLILVMK
jgi:hypothetical protein